MANSTCKLEYIAASEASKETTRLENFIEDPRVVPTIQEPLELYCNNECLISLTKEPKDDGRSKNIDRMYHYIRHKLKKVILW